MILTGIVNPDETRPAGAEDQPKSERWSVPPPALEPATPSTPPPAETPSALPPAPDSSTK
jgi:hypothetical protein